MDRKKEERVGRNIKARKKLSQLYRRGVEVRFGPSGGRIGPFVDVDGEAIPLAEDEVALWVAAPSPMQREMSMREAQAKRARTLLRAKRETDSEEHLTSKAFLAEMSFETLVDYVLSVQLDDVRNEAIRDVLSREEWSEMTDLQEAMRQFEESGKDKDDPEWADLLQKDVEYGQAVANRQAELLAAQREVLSMLTRDHLETRALERRAELVGSQAFMFEYERWMTYYSVRDIEDRDVLFFEDVDEWSEQEEEIREKVAEALSGFIQDGNDAKNLPRAEPGSEQSDPPSKQETTESSTPGAVSV